MKIRTKAFLIFQLATAIVTILVILMYCITIGITANYLPSFTDNIVTCATFVIPFSIALFPVWKLWKGKTWYTLSLLFFGAITIMAFLCFLIGMIYPGEWGFIIFWGSMVYIFYFPAILIISCLTGLIGKYILSKCNVRSPGSERDAGIE